MDCTPRIPNVQGKTLSWLLQEPPETKMALLSQHLQLAVLLINDLLDEEVCSFAGKRYTREKPNEGRYSRWGSNPSSLYIGKEKVPITVPRIYDNKEKKNITLERFTKLKKIPNPDKQLLNSMLLGLSSRDHHTVLSTLLNSFGLSKSAVSKQFVEESAKKLKEFQNRDLSEYNIVGLFLDGKYAGGEQIIIALGVTIEGKKIPLGFIQSATENAKSIKDQLLSSLIERGMRYQQGLFVIIDGAKGMKKAVEEVFGKYAIIQRCQWHKRENVISYLKNEDQEKYRKKLQKAYRNPGYSAAKNELIAIREELKDINISAANSLEEGLEETLTIQRLGLVEEFGRSFSTTNCIENLNSLLEKHTRKVKYWKNSDQRFRWTACALLEAEERMRRVPNYQNLHLLQQTITIEMQKRLE